MSTTVDAFVAKAASFIGYKEGPNNNTVFGQAYGLNFQPWCDMFVSYVAAAVGATDVVGRFAYCPSHVQWFRNRGQWGSTPRRGAIVFYSWDHGPSADHVGIVEAVLPDGRIQTIEGNTSSGLAGSQSNGDGCYRRVRTTTYVLGYGYPAYAAAPAGKPAPAPAPAPSGRAAVSLENLRASILRDGPAPTGFASNRGNTLPVEQALAKVGLLAPNLVDGSAGTSTFGKGSAYQKWQQRCGYSGADADGYPGQASLQRLGATTGLFTVVA